LCVATSKEKNTQQKRAKELGWECIGKAHGKILRTSYGKHIRTSQFPKNFSNSGKNEFVHDMKIFLHVMHY
jgi:hypothetical protein